MKVSKFIVDGDFCSITTDRFEESGVKEGQRVFVVGHRAVPEDEQDPYTQRIKFFVHLVKDKHVDFLGGMFVMDPRSLKKVGKNEQRNLQSILEQDTALGEETTTAG